MRIKNKWWKELKWWIYEQCMKRKMRGRAMSPHSSYRNPCKVEYLGYLEPCTPEAKKHMKKVHREKGMPSFKEVHDKVWKEQPEVFKSSNYMKKVHKEKGRPKTKGRTKLDSHEKIQELWDLLRKPKI